jgi:hypothetical protein
MQFVFVKKVKDRPLTLATLLIVAFVAVSAGCSSDSPSGPGPGTPTGGTGTGTLWAVARITGSIMIGGSPTSVLFASVADASLGPVVGATVTIDGPMGTITVPDDSQNPGNYSIMVQDYQAGNYTLTVSSGTDRIDGVSLMAPDIHVITYPTPQDLLGADQPIVVQWTRTAAADDAYVNTKDFFGPPQSDTGSMTVPASGNPARPDQRVSVLRTNMQTMAGGLPGSEFFGEITVEVEPIASQ